jgi:uncharacterized repeat protein (TIGR02543 family)
MKKLFLTSGLVLCMACPAFASQINYTPDNPATVETDEESYALQGEGTLGCVYPSTLEDPIQPTTFYAIWEARDDYTVTYKPGSVGSTPVRYVGGQTAAPTTGQVTYATYDDDYTVYTNANMASAVLTDGTTHGQVYEKTGYTFAGWDAQYDLETGAGISANNNQPYSYAATTNSTVTYGVSNPENVDLVAQWTPNRYNVIYNPNGHAKKTVVVDEEETLVDATNVTRENAVTFDASYTTEAFTNGVGWTQAPGYTFEGWSTSADTQPGSNSIIAATLTTGQAMSSAWTTDGNLTLYAIYSANKYSLTYVCPEYHSGTVNRADASELGTMSYTNMPFDGAAAPAKTPAELCAMTGYHPAGTWVCKDAQDSNITVPYSDVASNEQGATWSYAGNVQCTFEWAPNVITLNWEPENDGEATHGSCTYDLGIEVEDAPEKPGYEFKGWTTVNPDQQGGGQ